MLFLDQFFQLLFGALELAIIARALISWVPLDRYHPVVRFLDSVTEPILAPLRRYVPPIGGMMDITPIVALILLQILGAVVHRLLNPYGL